MSLFAGIEIPGRPDLENVRRLDLLPIPILRKMTRIGMSVDREYLWDLGSQFRTQKVELQKDIASYIPSDRLDEFSAKSQDIEDQLQESGESTAQINASSSEQIGKLLFEMLGVGEGMQLRTTKSGTRLSTGKRQLELLRMQHPVVPKILRYRELDKLDNTYCSKLPQLAVFHPHSKTRSHDCPVCGLWHPAPSWRIHGELGTTRAATGRLNHKNPNLGNIPTRTDDGQAVQAGFIATGVDVGYSGNVIAARDMSQIELRDLAHLTNCLPMIQTYEQDGDIHDKTARAVLKLDHSVKPDKIKHRMASKRANFSIQNGTTGKGLYLQLVMDYGQSGIPVPEWLTPEWCDWFLKNWLEEYPEVYEWFQLMWYRMRRYGMAWDLFGRVRLLPEGKSFHRWISQAGERYAQNFPVTSTAAGQLKLGLGQADALLEQLLEAGVWCWPLMTIHDSLMVECEEKDKEEVDAALAFSLDTVMQDRETGGQRFRVPIKSDGGAMERWLK